MSSEAEPTTEQIEAAARAVFDADEELDTGATWEQTSSEAQDWCRQIASAALVAARAALTPPADAMEHYREAHAIGALACDGCGHRLDLHDPPRRSHRPGICGGETGSPRDRCDCRAFVWPTSAAGDVSELIAALREIHKPETVEAEVWIDGPGSETHAEQWPDCTDCEGHEIKVQVCSECGYEHDGDTTVFRAWPCPTIVALDAAILAGR